MPIHIKGAGGSQKTPEISVSASGLITATAGNKSATKQLSSSMDSDFVAENIKNGVTIFGVTGTAPAYGYCVFDADSVTFSKNSEGHTTITINLGDENATAIRVIEGCFEFERGDDWHIGRNNYDPKYKLCPSSGDDILMRVSVENGKAVLTGASSSDSLYDDLKDAGLANPSSWESCIGSICYSTT